MRQAHHFVFRWWIAHIWMNSNIKVENWLMRYLLFMHDIQLHFGLNDHHTSAVLHLIVLSANIYKLRSCRKFYRSEFHYTEECSILYGHQLKPYFCYHRFSMSWIRACACVYVYMTFIEFSVWFITEILSYKNIYSIQLFATWIDSPPHMRMTMLVYNFREVQVCIRNIWKALLFIAIETTMYVVC